jgi:hypothetical protein
MWNYRVIRRKIGDVTEYGLYEVMYNDEKQIFAHSEEPDISGESISDLSKVLMHMVVDLEKHMVDKTKILDYDDIEFYKPCPDEDYIEIDPKDLLDTGVWPPDED